MSKVPVYGSFEDEYTTNESIASSLSQSSRRRYSNWRLVSMASVISTILIVSVILVSSNSANKSSSSTIETVSNNAAVNEEVKPKSKSKTINLTFARNGYEPLAYFNNHYNGLYQYKFLEDYIGIIEPSSEMEVVLYDEVKTSSSFHYEACTKSKKNGKALHSKSECYSGKTAYKSKEVRISDHMKVTCSPHDVLHVTIKEINEKTNETVNEMTGEAICMAVRREIRSLTTSDMAAFIAAAHVLWEVNDEEGQKLYGDDFHTNYFLHKFHYFNSAQQDADHIHGGYGFLPQHVKFDNFFEDSIRSVDPSVSLPYWDFTIDESESKTGIDSFLMTENIFGGITYPSNPDTGYSYEVDDLTNAQIPNGAWAGIQSPKNTEYPNLLYGYGYFRAPWNLNPSPYISRYGLDYTGVFSFPDCYSHYKALSQYDSLVDFLEKVGDGAHASTHTILGGIAGCDLLQEMVDLGYASGENAAQSMCNSWTRLLQSSYRNGWYTVDSGCEVNMDDVGKSSCSIQCTEDGRSSFVEDFFITFRQYGVQDKEDAEEVWSAFLCDGNGSKIVAGDDAESASPADPSFWVIHPTLERLLYARQMAGGFFNTTWPSDNACERQTCYNSTSGAFEYSKSCCDGHYEDSQLLDAINNDRYGGYGPTNGEIIAATNPLSSDYSVNYIYDGFTWDHCSYDFDALLQSIKDGNQQKENKIE
eukprot:gene4349-6153_t